MVSVPLGGTVLGELALGCGREMAKIRFKCTDRMGTEVMGSPLGRGQSQFPMSVWCWRDGIRFVRDGESCSNAIGWKRIAQKALRPSRNDGLVGASKAGRS